MGWLAVSGWRMTVVSLVVAGVQTYGTKRLDKRNREQLTLFIGDANYVSFGHELLDELAPKINDPMLQRYLVSLHQRACDLYRGLVDYYLSLEKRFTFEDRRRICQIPLISYKWQEDYWREWLGMRPENRQMPMAKRFLTENKSPRYKQYKERGSLPPLPESTQQND
jgi:hypothetical protein